ncbi:MAG: hypothetical protein WD118_06780 [Phycisphaeraceae bacterium]
MTIYSDEYLERMGDRYVALHLRGHGVTMVQYLSDPERYEALALEPMPLLPAQKAVQARLDAEAGLAPAEAEVAHLPQRNGAVVEPLHHHRHPRALACDFKRRTAQ